MDTGYLHFGNDFELQGMTFEKSFVDLYHIIAALYDWCRRVALNQRRMCMGGGIMLASLPNAVISRDA